MLVRENIQLIKKLNTTSEYQIYVMDNGVATDIQKGIQGEVGADILPGVPQDNDILAMCRGSYQHGTALNQFIRVHSLTTPYLLILDPDFYILRKEWIAEITAHMAQNELSFFGSVWHPRWFKKYRHFPSVHCMMIDSKRVPPATLNFMPDSMRFADRKTRKKESHVSKEVRRAQKMARSGKGKGRLKRAWLEIKSLFLFAPNLAHALYRNLLANRRLIASSLDTGYLIEKKYAHNNATRYEILTPVLNDDTIPAFWNSRINQWIENFLPDRWCYLPKISEYYSYHGFHSYGLPNLAKMQWEEFMWQGMPFAFHIRRQNKKNKTAESKEHEVELLHTLLNQIIEPAGTLT